MKNLVDKRAIQLETISGKTIIRDAGGVEALSTTVTPLQLLQSGKATFVVGMYRGALAVLDLDALVNQPLLDAEKAYVMGLLGGVVEGYDLKTTGVPSGGFIVGNAVGTVVRARLTVPANQVWFVSSVEAKSITGVAEAAGCTVNWRCSLWPDLVGVTPDADGGAIGADDVGAAGGHITTTITSAFGGANVYPLLRLPAGSSVTAVFTLNTAPLSVSAVGTLKLTGYVGKALVK